MFQKHLANIGLTLYLAIYPGGVTWQHRDEQLVGLRANQLKCEHLIRPLGVEASQPLHAGSGSYRFNVSGSLF